MTLTQDNINNNIVHPLPTALVVLDVVLFLLFLSHFRKQRFLKQLSQNWVDVMGHNNLLNKFTLFWPFLYTFPLLKKDRK